MKKLVLVISVLVIAGLMFSATEYKVENFSGKPGGTLFTWGLGDPKNFNPDVAQETSSTVPLGYTQGSLVGPDEFSVWNVPELAKEYWYSDDGLTFFIRIRDGIKWSDGEPFTIEDVYWNFVSIEFDPEQTANGNDSVKDANGNLPDVKIIDDTTISFTWTSPMVTAPQNLGGRTLVPKHIFEESVSNGTYKEQGTVADWDKIVGLGPYIMTEYKPGVRITFERNPYFWKVDANGIQLPYLDKINYEILGDQNTALLRFEAGELDHLAPRAEDFPRIAEMAEEKEWTVGVGGPNTGTEFLAFNFNTPDPVKREWFRNDNFRRAFVYLLDRDTIIESIYNGLGSPLFGPLSPSSSFYNPGVEEFGYKFSISRARLELKKGGFSWLPDGTCVDSAGNPVEFDMLTNAGNRTRETIGNIFVNSAEKVGIKINFRPIDFNTVVSQLVGATSETVIIGLTAGGADPSSGTNVMRVTGGLHFWNYPPDYDPKDHITEDIYVLPDWEKRVDEIFQLQASEVDAAKRWDLFAEYQMLFAEYQPMVYTITSNYLYAHKNELKLTHTPNTFVGILYNVEGIWKD